MKTILLLITIIPFFVFAHCPLCTAGAGIGALIAKELGMKSSVIGIWIGGFSVALGWWLANLLQKRFALDSSPEAHSPRSANAHTSAGMSLGQNRFIVYSISILISFFSIVFPLKLYFYETGSFYLYLFGDYGSLFNRTYVYDKFLLGSIIGGMIILISPSISKKIIQLRQGKIFPYQGLIINFLLMILISIIFQSML
ncbi:MAG: hypothetical protein KatS3mg096_568 [Candidatus Parcubacteria bacterium]|nr:MAG: hypothetical protein KatS3mg095_0952 [Candidatus Parcubacteria bacterium]GIW67700.1 MAG: hypothetical protein KatS3mg096_568 [Candidatus Parcubacteria bacterium]